MLSELLVLALAVFLDVAFGEPPRWAHPVVGLGKAISFLERRAPRGSALREFLYGLGVVVVTLAVAGGATYSIVWLVRSVSEAAYVVVGALLLKSAFAVRELATSAERVRAALAAGDLTGARSAVGAIVGRETDHLSPELVTSATVESVAENTTDSFLTPWLYFALFGIPGAIVYRAVNTLDSMVGHRGRYEWLGKAAAKLDTAANYVPARLAGLLIVVASFLAGHPPAAGQGAWRILRRDHARTASPNAGWTMSAMAGALGVQLEKVGHYRLGDPARPLRPDDVRAATRTMYVVAALGLGLALGLAAAVRMAVG
ncbi:MAG: cobalamin biosynthesis protein [Chloroflexi bacterium]|nr:cobalamin biosynthesis protein [Chloroflexota bacterium]